MTLDSLVTSLETSKKLQEAGFVAETDFYWYEAYRMHVYCNLQPLAEGDGYLDLAEEKDAVPCYTFEQLANCLPERFHDAFRLTFGVWGGYEFTIDDIYILRVNPFKANSAVETAAQAILWCIEQGYYQVKK